MPPFNPCYRLFEDDVYLKPGISVDCWRSALLTKELGMKTGSWSSRDKVFYSCLVWKNLLDDKSVLWFLESRRLLPVILLFLM